MNTTLLDAPSPAVESAEVPACLTRDNLTSPYFPNTSRAMLGVVIALAGIFVLTSFNRLNHTDLWGHLNFGRWIVEHRGLPAADPFAAEPTAAPMLHAAWLAQVTGYWVQTTFGNEGLAFGHALLVTLTAGVLMIAAVRRGMPLAWAWLVGVSFLLLDLPIAGTIRPQLFGQLGAALVLLACSELPARRHPLVWLPLLTALWANLHGSVLMGLAILGIYAAGVTWNVLRETWGTAKGRRVDPRIVRVWLAVALAVGGACVNPHGPLLLVKTIFFGEHSALMYITEWQAMSWLSLTGILLLGSSAAAAGLVKYSPRKWELYELALLALFALATLSAIRMLAWWAVVWPWVVVPHVAASWGKFKQSRGLVTTADEPTAMRTLLAMSIVFFALVMAPPTFSIVSGKSRGIAAISVHDAPVHVADEVDRRNLTGNIAAPMDWADFLVWQTHNQLKPLVYSHVHLTNHETWNDYVGIYTADENWLATLRRRNMQYLVVARTRSPELTRKVLMEDRDPQPGVRVIYQDQRSILAEVLPKRVATK